MLNNVILRSVQVSLLQKSGYHRPWVSGLLLIYHDKDIPDFLNLQQLQRFLLSFFHLNRSFSKKISYT